MGSGKERNNSVKKKNEGNPLGPKTTKLKPMPPTTTRIPKSKLKTSKSYNRRHNSTCSSTNFSLPIISSSLVSNWTPSLINVLWTCLRIKMSKAWGNMSRQLLGRHGRRNYVISVSWKEKSIQGAPQFLLLAHPPSDQ